MRSVASVYRHLSLRFGWPGFLGLLLPFFLGQGSLQAQSCYPAPTGIVAWWRGEGDATDAASSNHGVLQNGVGIVAGKVGQAFSFNGSSSYVEVAANPAFNPTGDLSMEAWIWPTASNSGRVIMGKWSEAGDYAGDRSYLIYLTPNNAIGFSISDAANQINSSFQVFEAVTNPVPLNAWSHVAVVYTQSNGTRKIYLNGSLIAQRVDAPITILSTNTTFAIGARMLSSTNTADFFAGLIDEPTLYTAALSASDVAGIFNAGSAGKCLPTVTPVIVVQPQGVTVDAELPASFSVSVSGAKPFTYQWEHNGVPIDGATNSTLGFVAVQPSDAGSYSVLVSNSVGWVSSSNAVLIVNAFPPNLLAQPHDATVNAGGSTNFSVTANGNAPLYYQWYFGGQPVSGATQSTFPLGNAQPSNAGTYAVTVSNLWGTATSTNVSLTVLTFPPGIVIQPVSKVVNAGASVNFNILAAGTAPLAYQWQIGGLPIAGATLSALNLSNVQLTNAGSYSALVTNLYGSVTSSVATLTVNVLPPAISTQPQSQTVLTGAVVTLSVAATGTSPLSYQWLENGTNLPGATTASLNLRTVQLSSSGVYSVQVTNPYGTALSSNAVVTVNLPTCYPVPAGLVGWWQADGFAADTVSTNSGSLMNGAGYAPGMAGQAFSLNGSGQFVQIPNSTNWAFGTNNFSIELWAKLAGTSATQALLAYDTGVGVANKWILWLTGGRLQLYVYNVGSGATSIGSVAFPNTPSAWHHIAVTRTGTSFAFYLDGALASTVISSVKIPAAAGPLTLGSAEGLYFLNGFEDEVSIYNRALAPSEVQGIFAAGSLGKCQPMNVAVILSNPLSQSCLEGTSVNFSILAQGTPPLSYQWLFNGTNLAGATAPALSLSNLTVTASGAYSAVVLNPFGGTTSSVATLTVNQRTCAPIQNGLIGWWQAEGDASDTQGNHSGTLMNGAAFSSGEVGNAFNFNGINQSVQVPNSASWAFGTNSFTIELWARLAGVSATQSLISYDTGAGVANKWIFWLTGGNLQFYVYDTVLGATAVGSVAYPATPNTWHHIALTQSNTLFSFYLDGVLASTASSSVSIPSASGPLAIGSAENLYFVNGQEDEISIYNRALAASEVLGVFNAGYLGKCGSMNPPSIVSQPSSQTVFAGANASFNAVASGSPLLAYQWLWNGTNLPGATTASLFFTNLSLSAAGTYALVVTNLYGTTTSSVATLTVNPIVCSPVTQGLVGWWRGEGDATDFTGVNPGSLQAANITSGKVGQAFGFDGSTTVQVPNSPSVNFTGHTPMSLEFWAYRTGTQLPMHLIGKRMPNCGALEYQIALDNLGLGFYGVDGNNSVITGVQLPVNAWMHLATTYDGTNFKFYTNGALAAVGVGALGILNSAPLVIGGSGDCPSFAGKLDEVSLYSRALSAAEVADIFNASSLGKCVPQDAPAITIQPQSLSAVVGTTALLSVVVTGKAPLVYQWSLGGTAIPGATSSSLSLPNIQFSAAGNYSVVITNASGSVTSSNAVVTVTPPVCISIPAGLVGWWRGEGDTSDFTGTYNGPQQVTVGAGKVGQALSFGGTSTIQIPDAPGLNFTGHSPMSLELWAFRTGTQTKMHLVGKRVPGCGALEFQLAVDELGLGFYGADANNSVITGIPLPINTWMHLAATYDGSSFRFYTNGVIAAVGSGVLGGLNNAPFTIGGSGDCPSFAGLLDEVSIYNRTLTPSEIQGIYLAGSLGKCVPTYPPSISAQPQSLSLVVGATANFTVIATGTSPLSYQWLRNGTNLLGASFVSLSLTNLQLTDAGTYSVLITNGFGSVTSTIATLVVSVPSCVPPPSGLVAWWSADQTVADSTGANHGTLINGAGYAAGEAGLAFQFNGLNQYFQVPASTNWTFGAGDFSLELWAKLSGSNSTQTLIASDGGSGLFNKWALWISNGQLQMHIYSASAGAVFLGSGAYPSAPGQWHHVAVTRHGTAFSFYVDGLLNSSANSSVVIPDTGVPLTLGWSENSFFLNGAEDEVSVYNQALSASQVQAIYYAGSLGKCHAPAPPGIFIQPQGLTAAFFTNVSFNVLATGTAPLSYQWFFDGTPLSGATNASLGLTNLSLALAGTYSVTITNIYGSLISSNATLVVIPPPTFIQMVSVVATSSVVTVPINIVATGNENALGFSLNYDPALLNFSGFNLGDGVANGSVLVNSNQLAGGRIGVAITLPQTVTLPAGTQQLAAVTFAVISATNAVSTLINFGDVPTVRQVSSPQAVAIPVTLTGGTVGIPYLGWEVDVAPFPNGDGAVTIIDWVQVGRFVAGLDAITNSLMFQRADCSPRNTSGDGILSVADWVQAGRYVAGLDPLEISGGPTEPLGGLGAFQPVEFGGNPGRLDLVPRALRVVNSSAFAARNIQVPIQLDAQGNENALGFSLVFDPQTLSLASGGVALGSNAMSATLVVNSNNAAKGQLGILIGLPIASVFPKGTLEVLKLNFAVSPAGTTNTNIGFASTPIRLQITDPTPTNLVTSFQNGYVAVVPAAGPSIKAAYSTSGLVLTWPGAASGYVLETSTDLNASQWLPVAGNAAPTGTDLTITIPFADRQHYYRLRNP